MRTRTEGTAKPRAPMQSRTPCQACAASAFFCSPGSGARSVGRRTVPSSKPTTCPKSTRMSRSGLPRVFVCALACTVCKRLVVDAVARTLCDPHRQPLPEYTISQMRARGASAPLGGARSSRPCAAVPPPLWPQPSTPRAPAALLQCLSTPLGLAPAGTPTIGGVRPFPS